MLLNYVISIKSKASGVFKIGGIRYIPVRGTPLAKYAKSATFNNNAQANFLPLDEFRTSDNETNTSIDPDDTGDSYFNALGGDIGIGATTNPVAKLQVFGEDFAALPNKWFKYYFRNLFPNCDQ